LFEAAPGNSFESYYSPLNFKNMATKLLGKPSMTPALLDEFFTPWSEFFGTGFPRERMMTIPPVNVVEKNDSYVISLAVPGFKKQDLKIDLDGNMLTVSSEKEESKEETGKKFTRNEYNFYSFSRTFTIPEDVKPDSIDANYEDGELKIKMLRKENHQNGNHKAIPVK
jgi:HSP20 family protein